MQSKVITAAAALLALGLSSVAEAHGGHTNLQVVAAPHQTLDRAMKDLSQGLGVKCSACHVKGAFDSDDLPSKLAAREFFGATVGKRSKRQRTAALDELLTALEIDRPKNEAKVWKAVRSLKKKRLR